TIISTPMSTSTSTPLTPCGLAWRIQSSPNVGASDNQLNGVSAINATDIWAVGYYTETGRYQTLAEHWDGTAWQVVATSNLGSQSNYLQGVKAVSSNDVWAVGYYVTNSVIQTLIEHWDGSI